MSHLNGSGILLYHMHQEVVQGQGCDTTLLLDEASLPCALLGLLEGVVVLAGTRLANVLEGGDMLVGLGTDKAQLAEPHIALECEDIPLEGFNLGAGSLQKVIKVSPV
jgi:hypothetical protein